MEETLYIEDFGPILKAELTIKPLMVFIGESGSGKSAILKLMSLLRWVHKRNNLRSYFIKNNLAFPQDFAKSLSFQQLLEISGLNEFINENTFFSFAIGEYKYEGKGYQLKEPILKEPFSLDKVLFLSENRGVLPDIFAKNFNRDVDLPYYLEDTYTNFSKAMRAYRKGFEIQSTKLTLLEDEVLEGNPYFVLGKGRNTKEYKLKFENASSGTKTASFVELIVAYHTKNYDFTEVLENQYKRLGMGRFEVKEWNGNKKLSIFIEEPELSLYPSAQRRLVNKLINDCFSFNKLDNTTVHLAFATHSPYIINHLNLLINAYDKHNTHYTEGAALSYENIGVWKVEEGVLKDLKAIDNHFIDVMDLSEDINEIYDNYEAINR